MLAAAQPIIAESSIHARHAGALIGIGGSNIQKLQQVSGARIELDSDDDRTAEWRRLTLCGSRAQVEAARCGVAALLRKSQAQKDEKKQERRQQRQICRYQR